MKNKFNIGNIIAYYRKLNFLTQEELAAKLNISAQAVSKWEQEISLPDISLIPEIAEIFSISIDELFGRKLITEPVFELVENVPWNDDRKIRIAVFQGEKMMSQSEHEIKNGENKIQIHFNYGNLYKINGTCRLIKS